MKETTLMKTNLALAAVCALVAAGCKTTGPSPAPRPHHCLHRPDLRPLHQPHPRPHPELGSWQPHSGTGGDFLQPLCDLRAGRDVQDYH